MTSASEDMLPPVSVLGFGAVTALGRDVQSLATLLGRPRASPSDSSRRVSDEWLADARVGRALRRAGRFPRMAVLAAMDAWDAAGAAGQDVATDRVGVVVATGLGPHDRTFKFLDGILDCGDNSASPTDFSHSVHNAAAAYITEILGWRGRSCTVTDFTAAFEQAVLLAQVWLAEGACDRVVVGAVEELGEVLLGVLPRLLGDASNRTDVAAGEGACFLTLGPATLAGFAHLNATAQRDQVDVLVMDEPALPSFEVQAASLPLPARQAVTFSPHFGHMATSSAFQTLGGLLCLHTGHILGQRISHMHDVRLIEPAVAPASLDSVQVYKRSSMSESHSLFLTRPGS